MTKVFTIFFITFLFAYKVYSACPANEAAYDGATISSTDNCTYNGTINLNGSLTIEAGGSLTVYRLKVLSGGSVTVNGTLIINHPGSGGPNGLFVNRGATFTVNSGGSVSVNNGGDVEIGFGANTGTITLDGTMNVSTGDFLINSGSTLTGSTGTLVVGGTYTDTDGSSPFTAEGGCDSGGCILPVELTTFNAQFQNNHALLKWTTAQEINSEGFFVEVSSDGINFKSQGFVEGNGNSDEINNYEFFDNDFHEKCYYRLKQVDFDGAYAYSGVIYLSDQNFSGELSIEIYPNPTSGSIKINCIKGGEFSLCLFDNTGKILFHAFKTELKKAQEELNEILPELERGVYILSCNSNETSIIEKLYKN